MSFQAIKATNPSNAFGIAAAVAGSTSSNTVTVDLSGQAGTTWVPPLNIDAVIKKYFELKGDVAGNPKEFINAIDSLSEVDDNFKAIKLYDLLKKGKHKDFEKYAKKYQAEMPGFGGITFSSDSDTGFYSPNDDSITITAGGNAVATTISAGDAVTLTSEVTATPERTEK